MEREHDRQTLEDVIDAYVEAVGEPGRDALTAWIRRYPHFERELTEFTVQWSLAEQLPPSRGTRADDERLILRGMSVVQGLLRERCARRPASAADARPIAWLVEEGARVGLKLRPLAAAVGLSTALVRQLDRRLVRFASIPGEAIEVLAGALRRTPDAIARSLDGTPRPVAAAQYRADEAPALAEPQDFFAAVRADTSLSDEQRARWLALAPAGDRAAQPPAENQA